MRFKLDGKWIRVTTGKRDREEAEQASLDYYMESKFKQKHSIPLQTRRFKPVAELAIKSMQDALNAGQGKKVYADYITVINGYLIPFFGKHNIDGIDYALLNQFDAWRIAKMNRVPRKSTIGTHNSALNRVFDEAINRKFVPASARPELSNKGVAGKVRPDFTLEEYRKLHQKMRAWIKSSRVGKTKDMRELLYDYMLIMLNTGMRHGTEAQHLCWKHVRIETINKQSQTLMYVDGKTGGREIVARHNTLIYLKRIHARTEAIKHLTFTELLARKSGLPVFCLPDGTVTDNLRATFKKFLDVHGLLIDPFTGRDRTLYSLRHTYATLALSHNVTSTAFLAKQMGTSEMMINKHYSHITTRMGAKGLAGIDHGQYDELDD